MERASSAEAVPAFEPLEEQLKIHKAAEIIYIFKGLKEWLIHLIRHFGKRSEPWDAVFGSITARKAVSLRDRIPGKDQATKEAYVEKIRECAEYGDTLAHKILRDSIELYDEVAGVIAQDLRTSTAAPRYAYFPKGIDKPGATTYVIGINSYSIMIIRGCDLRTCYFPNGCKSRIEDLPALQSYLLCRCCIRRSGDSWVTAKGNPAHPHNEDSLNWQAKDSYEPPDDLPTLPPPKGSGS